MPDLIRLPPAPPVSGWWIDSDPIALYHGTASTVIPSIAESGLQARPPHNKAYLTVDYETAKGYAIFGPDGGDIAVIAKRGKLHLWPPGAYAIAHFEIPRAFIEENAVYPEKKTTYFNIDLLERKGRLANRAFYDQQGESDSEFYLWSELGVSVDIPPEFFTGYSLPYCE